MCIKHSRSRSFHVGVLLYIFRELTKGLVILNLANLQWESNPVPPPVSGHTDYLGAIYVLIGKCTLSRQIEKHILQ